MQKIVITSGYFDPIHVGHIDYLKKAKAIGDQLVVIVNNDTQAELKKGRAFMPAVDRIKILESLRCVDQVFISLDTDKTVKNTLRTLRTEYYRHGIVIFAKGGDSTTDNIPEADVCHELGIYIMTGLGEKIESSSRLLKQEEKDE